MAPAEISEFKGRKVLVLKTGNERDDKFPFTFGVKKAKMILDNLDEIKQFVEENWSESGSSGTPNE